MAAPTLLDPDDLSRWRACARRFWLQRRESPAHAPEPAVDADAAIAPISLEIVGRELAAELRHEGHADLLSVAEERLADPRHRRALRAVREGAPVIEPAVAALLRAHGHPRRMLRLDTIGFAVPVWAGTRPYQVLPFQWTCDLQAAPGLCEHHAFLAGVHGDPRREFAQTLLHVGPGSASSERRCASEALVLLAPRVTARHQRGLDAGTLDGCQVLVERRLVHQRAVRRVDADVARTRIDVADVAAAGVGGAAHVAVPVDEEAFGDARVGRHGFRPPPACRAAHAA